MREAALEKTLADAKRTLPDHEVAAAQVMSDEEAERRLAEEITIMKARDPREYERLLASMPQAEQAKMHEVVRKYSA